MNLNQDSALRGNILIVDDTPDEIRILSAILAQKGYEVRKSLNGQMALTTAKNLPPDVILLDINMPGMNGYEVCTQLKSDERTQEIPVIFISALDDVLDKVQAFNVGGADYITKPFHNQEVLVRVANHLTIRRQQKQLAEQNTLLQEQIEERKRAEAALRVAQEKSEQLLLNILPKPIAEQLKSYKGAIAEQFEEATILFADIVGFTSMATQMPAIEVVDLLNQIFSEFDLLAEQHGLEKIKTIGDAYMVAGGLPTLRSDHAIAVVEMALDMQKAIGKFQTASGDCFQIRIGINSGPVVAGVIGTRKFIYDLWGDTVNVASRMESQGWPGKIQVTERVYEQLQQQYEFEFRGEIEVKGKGEMKTYWLKGRKVI